MITKKTKTTYAVVILASIIATASCNENYPLNSVQRTNSATKLSQVNGRIASYTFDGTEGDPITLDVASRWITNYTSQNNNALSAHFFGNKSLQKLLSKNGSLGIRFYYAKDDEGNNQLLAVPADKVGNDFLLQFEARAQISPVDLAFTGSTAMFTGNETDSVSLTAAQHSIANFYSSNPKGIVAHFFGYEILQQILTQNNCVGIRCYYALNDSGVQQLLLIGVTSNGTNILPTSTGVARAEDGGGTVADASFPCPAMCSGQ